MPGIYGYVKDNNENSMISQMTSSLKENREHLIKDDDFVCENIEASRVHLGTIGMKNSPFTHKNVVIWVEGECYNLEELRTLFSFSQISFEEGISNAYYNDLLDDYLNKIDGYFCAVIYDQKKKKLFLFSDRYGMRLLYYYYKDGTFSWSSEVKGILALNGVDKTINKTSLSCFMDLGHLVEDNTFLNYIKLLNPATILEFDIKTKKYTQSYYWKWSEIKQQDISFEDAATKLGDIFISAVKKRYLPQEKISIPLSGGLDSRAIFAAVNTLYPESTGYAYTFGIEGCDDIEIAKSAVKLSHWKHKSYFFNSQNWFEPRIEKVWQTDGMYNIMDMHGSESEIVTDVLKTSNINLNGYLGGAVLGGSYFNRKQQIDLRVNKSISQFYYQGYIKDYQNKFFQINHFDPFLFMNRGRRFINMGITNALSDIEQRLPFFDNKLIEFIFSLPDEYRVGHKLYASMLLKTFPTYFKTIPWKNTGMTIDKKITLWGKVKRRLKWELRRRGMIAIAKNYHNYPDWIRDDNTFSEIEKIVSNKSSYIKKYLDIDIREKYLLPHLKENKNNSEQILRATTIELYLQRVFYNDSM